MHLNNLLNATRRHVYLSQLAPARICPTPMSVALESKPDKMSGNPFAKLCETLDRSEVKCADPWPALLFNLDVASSQTCAAWKQRHLPLIRPAERNAGNSTMSAQSCWWGLDRNLAAHGGLGYSQAEGGQGEETPQRLPQKTRGPWLTLIMWPFHLVHCGKTFNGGLNEQ